VIHKVKAVSENQLSDTMKKLKQCIIKLVPDVVIGGETEDGSSDTEIIGEVYLRPINLEDVLRAMNFDYDFTSSTYIKVAKLLRLWTLGKPLDDQPKEVINFLKEILL